MNISFSVTIHAISSFDSVYGTYEGKFTVNLKWFDSRLVFANLRDAPKVNGFRPDEIGQIWFPHFKFENTKKKESSLLDSKSSPFTREVFKRTNNNYGFHSGNITKKIL